MKKLLTMILAVLLILTAAGCKSDAPGGELCLGSFDFAEANKIRLQNAHNGEVTFITDPEQIDEIAAFISGTWGIDPESGKGYYEGSYSVEFCLDEEKLFSMAFGDSDCFYTGKGADGYPLRYILKEKTIRGDVIPFFSAYDESGFDWN